MVRRLGGADDVGLLLDERPRGDCNAAAGLHTVASAGDGLRARRRVAQAPVHDFAAGGLNAVTAQVLGHQAAEGTLGGGAAGVVGSSDTCKSATRMPRWAAVWWSTRKQIGDSGAIANTFGSGDEP